MTNTQESYENNNEQNKAYHNDRETAQGNCTCNSSRRFGLVFPFVPEDGDMQKLLNRETPLPYRNDAFSVTNSHAKRQHTLLEADNILSLNVLRNTHYGKVDVIYIDPPYNTGNQDFTYNDKYVDKEDTFKHSKWLSFMKPRLELARELLTPEGFIAISIDDNEYATLKLLCDQIFGESNFVGTTVWKSATSFTAVKHLSKLTEYVLMYAKDKSRLVIERKKLEDTSYKLKDEFFEERGAYVLERIHTSSLLYRKNMDYPLKFEGKTYYPGGGTKEEQEERHSQNLNGKNGYYMWRWGRKQMQFGIDNGVVVAKNGKLYAKRYYKANFRLEPIDRTVPYTNLIMTDEHSSAEGTNDMKKVFGERVFTYPKPVGLVKRFVKLHPNKNATVLDFFAGSGTTGQAVLELNREDGGERTFILATNNFEQDGAENGIARGITAERIRRIIRGERAIVTEEENQPFTEDSLNYYTVNTVRYANTDTLNPEDWAGVLELEHSARPELTVVENNYVRVENDTEIHLLFTNSEEVELGEDTVSDVLDNLNCGDKELFVYSAGGADLPVVFETENGTTVNMAPLPHRYVSTVYANVDAMKLG